MASGMPPSGSRVMIESSAHSVMRGAIPDASVPRATRTPTTSTRWCGFGNGRRFTAGKLTRSTVRPRSGAPTACMTRRSGAETLLQVSGVLLPETACEAGEQLLREAGMVEQGVERALADLGDLELRVGDHARV